MSEMVLALELLVNLDQAPGVSPPSTRRTRALDEDYSDDRDPYSGDVTDFNHASVIFLVGIFVFILAFALVRIWLCETPSAHRKTAQEKAERLKYIRETVVSKTVVKKKRQPEEDDTEDDDNSLLEAGQFSDANPSPSAQSPPGALQRQKTDLRLSSRHGPEEEETEDEKRLECQICLADFEIGDHICWSRNPKCVHTFHMECLEPWLMKHDRCPLCRLKYLVPVPEQERPKEPAANSVGSSSFLCNLLRRRGSVDVAPGHQNTPTNAIEPNAGAIATTTSPGSTCEQSTEQEGEGAAACADECSSGDIETGDP